MKQNRLQHIKNEGPTQAGIKIVLNLATELTEGVDNKERPLTARQKGKRREIARHTNDLLRDEGVQIFDRDHFDLPQ